MNVDLKWSLLEVFKKQERFLSEIVKYCPTLKVYSLTSKCEES